VVGIFDPECKEYVLARLGVGDSIEGGVGGSDVSGEFETGERCCGACVIVGSLISCVDLRALTLRLTDFSSWAWGNMRDCGATPGFQSSDFSSACTSTPISDLSV
jgi:hypothetical protein